MFAPEARTEISFEDGFEFFKNMYLDVRKHRGGAFRFRKHFLGPDDVPYFSGKEGDGGEEFQCAQMLDSLNESSFGLGTSRSTSTPSDCRLHREIFIRTSSRN